MNKSLELNFLSHPVRQYRPFYYVYKHRKCI